MSIDRIRNTNIWCRTLGSAHEDPEGKRDELRFSFENFRKNAAHLVSGIAGTLPGLTQHDISHLDALWEVADLICGKDFPVNPLEAYVFGGSVLLHDSALCFEAYDGGVEAVRNTTVWNDSFASLPEEIEPDEAKKIADFSALRALHASQAEKLVEKEWLDPDTSQKLYLIEDFTLRKHLGKLIGKIAASHHWPIEDVEAKLPSQFNVIPGYPRDWRIDPIKIACMLRCADAAHIDNERAPDFLYALIKRSGLSLDHWRAQNKLASVDIDQADVSGSTLLFASTHKFLEEESEAWWVAYDTVCMIDKEIRSANTLLESRNFSSPQFKVKRVKGVESPEQMSKYIETEGWSPCSAEVHVGNVENLVKSLGGEKLYGANCDKLEVIIRELIQNARDSILARREIEDRFSGSINVRLVKAQEGFWLYIEDDGVGMSKRVLTGPLLDFGASFWTSSLVQSEFPGLRSSKFRPVGQFGIGFYSVFMGADKVSVSSKPWIDGLADVWQLKFNNGLSLRPLLKNSAPEDFGTNISTQIKLHIPTKIVKDQNALEIKRNLVNSNNLYVSIRDYICAICAGLDVTVSFEVDGSKDIIHEDIQNRDDKKDWLKKISFSDYQDSDVNEIIEHNAHRLRPIIENGKWYGLAAISISEDNSQNFLSARTVGGLSSGIHARGGRDYIGYIDFKPKSAQREAHKFSASQEGVDLWVKEQIEILQSESISAIESCFLGYSLHYFNADPIEFAKITVRRDGQFLVMSFEELARAAEKSDVVFMKTSGIDHVDIHSVIKDFPEKFLFTPIRNSAFLSLKMSGGKPEDDFSAIGCLYRKIEMLGGVPEVRIEKNVGRSVFGEESQAVLIRSIK